MFQNTVICSCSETDGKLLHEEFLKICHTSMYITAGKTLIVRLCVQITVYVFSLFFVIFLKRKKHVLS